MKLFLTSGDPQPLVAPSLALVHAGPNMRRGGLPIYENLLMLSHKIFSTSALWDAFRKKNGIMWGKFHFWIGGV